MSMPASITNVALFFKPTLYIKSEVENPYSAPALNRGLSHLLTATLFVVCCLCSFTHFHPYPCPKYWWISLTYKTSTKHSTVWLIGMERHSNILSACFTVAKFLDPNYHWCCIGPTSGGCQISNWGYRTRLCLAILALKPSLTFFLLITVLSERQHHLLIKC